MVDWRDPASVEVQRRAHAASVKQAGSDNDIAEIRAVVLASYPGMHLKAIRWASNAEVFVLTSIDMYGCWCVVKKEGSHWHFVKAYEYMLYD